jgi:hypothetical protein
MPVGLDVVFGLPEVHDAYANEGDYSSWADAHLWTITQRHPDVFSDALTRRLRQILFYLYSIKRIHAMEQQCTGDYWLELKWRPLEGDSWLLSLKFNWDSIEVEHHLKLELLK